MFYTEEKMPVPMTVTTSFFLFLCIWNLIIHLNYLHQALKKSSCKQRCYINIKQSLWEELAQGCICLLLPWQRNDTVFNSDDLGHVSPEEKAIIFFLITNEKNMDKT